MAESNGDLKKTWQTLKQAMNREGKSNPLDKLKVNGNEINDKMKIAEYCNDLPQVYFQRAHGRHTALREIYLQDQGLGSRLLVGVWKQTCGKSVLLLAHI